jgi:uncharacterized phage protein gp47/JayE
MTAIVVKTREEWRDYWLKCFSNRNSDADVGSGSYPWLRASAQAEVLTILSGDALAIGDTIPLDMMTGRQLDDKYGSKLPRNLETNSSGYITIQVGSAGSAIQIGDILVHAATKNTYKVTSPSATYLTGAQLAVSSVDPGVGQNLAAGEVLQWQSPRPGCYATATVFLAPDGSGIIGGRSTESDDEYRERIRDFNANPIGHGNEGDLIALVEASREHGVPVEKCFVYPAVMGPGTVSYTFTVKRDHYWESRRPTSGQISTVFAYVSGKLPGDFSITPADIYATDTRIYLSVALDQRYVTWADFVPWPEYSPPGGSMIYVQSAVSATEFTLVTSNGSYSGVTGPSTGNTIALYDSAFGVFRRKKILTVTGAGPWAVVCDVTLEQSDTTYTPWFGQAVSPWFDAINDCAAVVGAHMAQLGPGETVPISSLPEDGTRLARQPRPYPGQFDSDLTGKIAFDVVSGVPAVASCILNPTSNTVTTPTITGSVSTVSILDAVDVAIYKA